MKLVLIENRFHGVPDIILNRPEKKNALSIGLMEELLKVLEDYSASDKVRGIILSGAGGHFCSGLDLHEATSDDLIEKSSITLRNLYHVLSYFPKPTVASVRGNALAGGLGLAALCDLVVCGKSAKFQFPEVHRGLVPAYLLTVLKGRYPRALLRAMSLFAYPISGEEALNFGVAQFLVEDEEMEKKLEEIALLICNGAPGAQFHIKNLLNQLFQPRLQEELNLSDGLHRKARESDEAREGVAAFFEKRAPHWCKHENKKH